jgi:uncharacterized surface protein with fasciclin (FAS1) repeats
MSSVLRTLLAASSLSLLSLAACGGPAQTEAGATSPTSANAKSDIVDTAVNAGSFKTLATALKAAGLIDTLKGPGPFTVFAPTDDAFAKLPAGTVDDLLKPENKAKLTSILTYHVVSGHVGSSDVMKLKSAKTVQGGEVTINAEGGGVTINGAKVTKADIECSNGVIHVIDTVILPK